MKKWETPKLVVLVRGKPEECILTNCKFVGHGPNETATNCMNGELACVNCFDESET